MTYRTGLLLGLTALLGGCETTLPVELPDHPPQITLNSFFQPDSVWTIHLREARSVVDGIGAIRLIPNATVEIQEAGGPITRLVYAGDGFYEAAAGRPIAGRTYTARASAPGYENVEATDTAPTPIAVSFDYRITYPDDGAADFDITIQFTDPVDQPDFYRIHAFYRYESDDSSLTYARRIFTTSDESIIAENGSPFEVEESNEFTDAFFTDHLFQEARREIKIELQTPVAFRRRDAAGRLTIYPGGTLVVFVYNLSKAYYDYATTYRLYDEIGDNPFAEPVRVYTNVENGFGIFAGFNRYTLEVDVLERP